MVVCIVIILTFAVHINLKLDKLRWLYTLALDFYNSNDTGDTDSHTYSEWNRVLLPALLMMRVEISGYQTL